MAVPRVCGALPRYRRHRAPHRVVAKAVVVSARQVGCWCCSRCLHCLRRICRHHRRKDHSFPPSHPACHMHPLRSTPNEVESLTPCVGLSSGKHTTLRHFILASAIPKCLSHSECNVFSSMCVHLNKKLSSYRSLHCCFHLGVVATLCRWRSRQTYDGVRVPAASAADSVA